MSLADDAKYDDVFPDDSDDAIMNIFFDRHVPMWFTPSIADIPAGHEILDNYIAYSWKQNWKRILRVLKSLCSGRLEFATVRKYEKAKEQQTDES